MFMKNFMKNRTSGFTIIELMVAMAVMAFGLLGFLFLHAQAVGGRVSGREMGRASVVARDWSETLMALDYDDSLLDVGTHPTVEEDTWDGGVDNQLSTRYGNFIYNTTWDVTTNTSRLKTVVVSTTWKIKDNQKGMQTKKLTLMLLKIKGM